MRLGIICEGTTKSPDMAVHSALAKLICPDVELVIRPLGIKPQLKTDAGKTTKGLIEIERCMHVLIVWDLYPGWREGGLKPDCHVDSSDIARSLDAADVCASLYTLICVREELEAWLVAHGAAVTEVIKDKCHPHPADSVAGEKQPDAVQGPKTRLKKIFQSAKSRYDEAADPIRIVNAMKGDLKPLLRSSSFEQYCRVITALCPAPGGFRS